MFTQPSLNEKLTHWGLGLGELDIIIAYKPGKQDQAIDALYHIPSSIYDLHSLYSSTTHDILCTYIDLITTKLTLDTCTTFVKE